MADGNTETPEYQVAFDLPEASSSPKPPESTTVKIPETTNQAPQEPELAKTVQEEENKNQAKKTEQYRPYCGEGHGKMIPSKFGGYWCPKCRGR